MAFLAVQADTNEFRFGTQSLRVTTGDAGSNALYPSEDVHVVPNESYAFSVYVKTDEPLTGGGVRLDICTAGTLVTLFSSDVITDSTDVTETTEVDGWQRLILTFTAPDGANTVRPVILYTGSTAGQVFWLDGTKFEPGDVASVWAQNIVSKALVLDQGAVQIDASEGGLLRLRGADGAARSTVSLGDEGLVFGGDTEVASPSIGVLEVNGVPIGGSITVEEVDGAPSVSGVTKIKFASAAVTDNGDDSVTVTDFPAGTIGASVTSATAQTGVTVNTAKLFAVENFDTDGFHSTSSNTSRMTIPTGLAGKYLVMGTLYLTAITAGSYVGARIWKNGTTAALVRQDASPDGNSLIHIAAILDLVAGDYLELASDTDDVSYSLQVSGPDPQFSIIKLDSGRVGTGIGARVTNSTTQSVPNATGPVLTMDTEEFDTDGFHSLVSNTSRLTIPAGLGGIYLISGGTYFASDADGSYRIVAITKNGVAVPPHMRAEVSSPDPALAVSVILKLVAGDYIEIIAYHDSGGNLNIGHASTAEFKSTLAIMRLDSLPTADPEEWQTYTPAWTSTGTAPAIGNAVVSGRYKYIGPKTIVLRIAIIFGTTSTYGTGQWRFTLPVAMPNITNANQVLGMIVVDAGTSYYVGQAIALYNSTSISALLLAQAPSTTSTAGARELEAAVPFTWTTNDQILIQGVLEIA